jgi:hypothetical protein
MIYWVSLVHKISLLVMASEVKSETYILYVAL